MFNYLCDKGLVADRLEQHIYFFLLVAHDLSFAKAGVDDGAANGEGLSEDDVVFFGWG